MSALPMEDAVQTLHLAREADLEVVEVDAAELMVGQTLTRPIHDLDGTLLLAEGLRITPEFKRLLRDRRIRRVRLCSKDVPEAKMRAGPSSEEHHSYLDNALTARLDEIIDSGLLFVMNSESAVLDRMPVLGCQGYSPLKHRELVERNKRTSRCVDDLIRARLRGKEIDPGELTQLTIQYLGSMTEDIDSVLASVAENAGEHEIATHNVDVALLAMAIGIEMGLDATNVRHLGVAGLVHDWGMSRVAPETLRANRRLTKEEFCEITRHPIDSLRLLEKLPGIPSVVPMIAYQVHERPNGSGYPKGRTDERIHPLAKIVAVADMFHALTSPRPFRPPLMPYAAMECLLRQAAVGNADPETVRALLKVQSLFPIGSYVLLSDGSVACVLRRNGDNYTQPIVRLVQDRDGADIPPDSDAAIIDLDQAGLEGVQALPTPGREETGLSLEILEWTDRENDLPFRSGQEPAWRDLCTSRCPVQRSSPRSASLELYTAKQKRQAQWALEFLDEATKREDKWYRSSRKHPRSAIRSVVHVCIPKPGQTILDLGGPSAFSALVRDISPGGLSFIHPAWLNVDYLIIGIESVRDQIRWFHAEVVRSREITEADFWEYGVVFRGRILT